ncbi:B12-binding domain-containing radical SAM protein [Planctomycetota bacterium]
MEILLVAPRYHNRNVIDYNYPFPLGLGYIAAAVKRAGFRLQCLNMNHCAGTIEDILNAAMDAQRYDIVLTGNNSLGFATTARMLNAIKTHPTRPTTVLGGPIITTEPELVMQYTKSDYGVIGEGEVTIVDLLDCIGNDRDPDRVRGIAYRRSEKIRFTEHRMPPNDLDTIPFPDLDAFDFESWIDNKHPNDNQYQMCLDDPRPYMILGSRGCPFNCTFCYHENSYRERSIRNSFQEIDVAVRTYRANLICFADDCFAAKRERLEAFCDRMRALRGSVSWPLKWSCQLTVKGLSTETLKLLKESGCDSVSYGFESYSPTVLRSMKKPISPEEIDFAFESTLREGISIQANFIFGDPAETLETAHETIRYWQSKCFGQVNLGFVKPYPGSRIYDLCLQRKLIKNKLYYLENGIENILEMNMTKLSDGQFRRLARYIFHLTRTQYRYVLVKRLRRNGDTYSLRIKCPFCRKKLWYRNIALDNVYDYSFGVFCRHCGKRYFAMGMLARLALVYFTVRYYAAALAIFVLDGCTRPEGPGSACCENGSDRL